MIATLSAVAAYRGTLFGSGKLADRKTASGIGQFSHAAKTQPASATLIARTDLMFSSNHFK
ncbi:MAG TPA: hypothetical protein VGF45_05515, partial [Polyangia bacterium]